MVSRAETKKYRVYINAITPIKLYWKFYNNNNNNNNKKKKKKKRKKFFGKKNSDSFHIPAQNIECGYSLEPPREAVLTNTHNLCFFSKIRKIMFTPVNSTFTV